MKFLMTLMILATSNLGFGAIVESNYLEDSITQAKLYGATYGAENVAVVFDVDNTLLNMNQDLGTHQWFGWQKGLLSSGQSIAKDMTELLDIQQKLYVLSGMHPVQTNGAAILKVLQNLGFPTLALTARGATSRDATLRELKKADMDFSKSSLAQFSSTGHFKPYDINNLEVSGISQVEKNRWNLKEAREVAFEKGVFLANGQHKGAMLKTIFQQAPNIKAVIFVDDSPKNVHNVNDAFENSFGMEVTAFRYGRLDEEVHAFENSEKLQAKKDWVKLNQTLKAVFAK